MTAPLSANQLMLNSFAIEDGIWNCILNDSDLPDPANLQFSRYPLGRLGDIQAGIRALTSDQITSVVIPVINAYKTAKLARLTASAEPFTGQITAITALT